MPVLAGAAGWLTWGSIFIAFGIAGIIRGIREVNDDNQEHSTELSSALTEVQQANDNETI
jgi:hypothetical protein